MLSQAIMAFNLIKKLHLTDYDCQLMTATASPSSTKKALKSNTIAVSYTHLTLPTILRV